MRILRVYAKTCKTSFGRRSLRDLCVCAHMCLNTNSFLSRIRILKTNCNQYNDHSSYKFSLVCNCSKEQSFRLKPIAELPTSTFLPYFVRFLKENTIFNFFFFFFFFFYLFSFFFKLESDGSTLHTLFML